MAKEEKKTGVAKAADKKEAAKKDAKKAAAAKKAAPAKNDGRRGPIRYIKDVWQELKKVTWPTKKELLHGTIAVIGFVAAFTLIIWLMDLAVTPVFQWLIG
ncbi:MAG: preprotein translocase subunit SecE [Clostridia bacterium]|nr:preprotein translocase subunit SecE [Clostridia bacterium]